MIEFNDEDLSGDQMFEKAKNIMAECDRASKGKGLSIRFADGTPSFVLTFNLRHIANEIDKLASLDPASAAEHFKAADEINRNIKKFLNRLDEDKNIREFDIETEEDLNNFYRMEGLELPDETEEV